jgi:hypothetical protein
MDLSPNRRGVLRSTAGLVAAAAGTASLDTLSAVAADETAAAVKNRQTALNGQKLVGFMLAHEQFTVPQLTDLGAAAARAGFGLLATSDHFQPWQANEAHVGAAWVATVPVVWTASGEE